MTCTNRCRPPGIRSVSPGPNQFFNVVGITRRRRRPGRQRIYPGPGERLVQRMGFARFSFLSMKTIRDRGMSEPHRTPLHRRREQEDLQLVVRLRQHAGQGVGRYRAGCRSAKHTHQRPLPVRLVRGHDLSFLRGLCIMHTTQAIASQDLPGRESAMVRLDRAWDSISVSSCWRIPLIRHSCSSMR